MSVATQAERLRALDPRLAAVTLRESVAARRDCACGTAPSAGRSSGWPRTTRARGWTPDVVARGVWLVLPGDASGVAGRSRVSAPASTTRVRAVPGRATSTRVLRLHREEVVFHARLGTGHRLVEVERP